MLGLDSDASFSRLPNEIWGKGKITCTPEKIPINAGLYTVNVALFSGAEMADYLQAACTIDIAEGPYLGTNLPPTSWSLLAAQQRWDVKVQVKESK